MRTFILFIFGMFDDYDDIEYFCTQILSESPLFLSVRFIIEREINITINKVILAFRHHCRFQNQKTLPNFLKNN